MTGLSAENIVFRYSGNAPPVLCDFSLKAPKGSITLLSGASGCGKSTLCGVLAGIYPRHGGVLESGRVLCDGVDIQSASISQRSRVIGMMFQNPDLQFCMDTVENELVFCLENILTPPQEIPLRVDEALAFCEIKELRKRKLHTLSGGEKQKVMLACIAALGSSYIILDEPFANIDAESGRLLCERLQRFQKERGTTMLIVDHEVSNFLHIADEHIIMGTDQAHQEEYACPAEKKKPETIQAAYSLQEMRAGHDGVDVLCGVNIDFFRGCMTAITGKSGSGKSTLLSSLARMNPYKGSIKLDGKEISRIGRRRYSQHTGIVFQNPQDQFVANTVYDEIAVSLRVKYKGDDLQNRIRACLEEIGLWEYRDFSPYMLSQGQQRRLAVGALLAYECKVLLCDEPTYGQDKRSVQAIMGFLRRRVENDGLTVIFSTHDLALANSYGDYHYICAHGRMFNAKDI